MVNSVASQGERGVYNRAEGGEGSGGQLGGQIEFGQQNSPKAAAKTYQVSDFVVVYVAAAAAALRPFCTVLPHFPLSLSLCFSLPRFCSLSLLFHAPFIVKVIE